MSINNARLAANTTNNDDTDDYFGLELRYNTGEANLSNHAYFNGNISAVLWKGIGETPGVTNFRHSYKFTYDKANRLETAVSQTYYGTRWNREIGALNEQLSYDHNGNILTLQRNQLKYDPATPDVRTSEVMDNLTYTYETQQGNRLLKVEDASGNLAGFKNGANVATEYTYDVNGNTLTDQNKGISSVVYNVLGKPDQVIFSDGRKLVYVYDAGGTKLTMKTYQGTTLQTTTDYVGSFVYENGALQFFSSPEGRVVKNGSTLDYQYAIADHQGNTRVVFTSATPAPAATNADFEAATNTAFENYINRSSLEIFDHTDTGPTATSSQLLNGGVNGQVGLAKTLKVYPGDKVKIDAYAKYWNIGENTSNVSAFATMLTSAFGVSGASTGDALKAYNTLSSYGGLVAAGTAHSSAAGDPKGFVTILLFDKDFNFLDAAWDQLDDVYAQGTNIAVKNAFDHLLQEVTIKEEGYAYIYLSNESPTLVDIYFDDVTVTHTKSRVIQYNEYYPFGLQTSSSWTRENTIGNRFLYNQGSELNAQSGWYETMFRGYDPGLGRFMQVDPLAVEFADVSPYNYGLNNPVLWNDPNGDRPVMVSTNGDYSNWLMPDGSLEPVRNPYSIMSEFTNGLDMSMTNHWANGMGTNPEWTPGGMDYGYGYANGDGGSSSGGVTLTGSSATNFVAAMNSGAPIDFNFSSSPSGNVYVSYQMGIIENGHVGIEVGLHVFSNLYKHESGQSEDGSWLPLAQWVDPSSLKIKKIGEAWYGSARINERIGSLASVRLNTTVSFMFRADHNKKDTQYLLAKNFDAARVAVYGMLQVNPRMTQATAAAEFKAALGVSMMLTFYSSQVITQFKYLNVPTFEVKFQWLPPIPRLRGF